jgi:hypothetical protein
MKFAIGQRETDNRYFLLRFFFAKKVKRKKKFFCKKNTTRNDICKTPYDRLYIKIITFYNTVFYQV